MISKHAHHATIGPLHLYKPPAVRVFPEDDGRIGWERVAPEDHDRWHIKTPDGWEINLMPDRGGWRLSQKEREPESGDRV